MNLRNFFAKLKGPNVTSLAELFKNTGLLPQ
jgi:hypothetical protein